MTDQLSTIDYVSLINLLGGAAYLGSVGKNDTIVKWLQLPNWVRMYGGVLTCPQNIQVHTAPTKPFIVKLIGCADVVV